MNHKLLTPEEKMELKAGRRKRCMYKRRQKRRARAESVFHSLHGLLFLRTMSMEYQEAYFSRSPERGRILLSHLMIRAGDPIDERRIPTS